MPKLTSKFLVGVKEDIKYKQTQRTLQKKYNLDENVKVIEKNNFLKTIINTIFTVIKIISTIILLTLAVIGLLCIIYPGTREQLILILNDIVIQIQTFI